MTLDEKIIFLENDIEKLNFALYKQDKKISELEKTLQILNKNIQNSEEEHKISNDKPPHY